MNNLLFTLHIYHKGPMCIYHYSKTCLIQNQRNLFSMSFIYPHFYIVCSSLNNGMRLVVYVHTQNFMPMFIKLHRFHYTVPVLALTYLLRLMVIISIKFNVKTF